VNVNSILSAPRASRRFCLAIDVSSVTRRNNVTDLKRGLNLVIWKWKSGVGQHVALEWVDHWTELQLFWGKWTQTIGYVLIQSRRLREFGWVEMEHSFVILHYPYATFLFSTPLSPTIIFLCINAIFLLKVY